MALNIEKWLKENTWDLQGKVVVMTGAAGGLGSVLSRYLLQCNASLIMLERDVERMESLSKQLREEFANAERKIDELYNEGNGKLGANAEVLLKDGE